MEAYPYGQHRVWRSHAMLPDQDILDIQDIVETKAKQKICWRFFNDSTDKKFIKLTKMQGN